MKMNRFRRYTGHILGFWFLFTGTTHAQDRAILDGNDVDGIVRIARNYGSATFASQPGGAPKILGRIEGINYSVLFINCDQNNRDCTMINFYTGFLDVKTPVERINAWNSERFFGRAYLDQDQDAVVEMDVNLQFGVTQANLDSSFAMWRLILDQFTTYIEFGAAPAASDNMDAEKPEE